MEFQVVCVLAHCNPNQDVAVCGFVDGWVGYAVVPYVSGDCGPGMVCGHGNSGAFIKALIQWGFELVITFLAE